MRQVEEQLVSWLPSLLSAQSALAELDCLLALATAARDLQLVKPMVTENDAGVIDIKGGWNPLLGCIGDSPSLVPNDCQIGSIDERLMLLTGPNASGKSVYLRTVALIVYLAHVGSFVPAEAATVARTDAIHTRMHSKESAAVNHSAFMLDLSQMANIFRHSTSRSLCLIDEFGKVCLGACACPKAALQHLCLPWIPRYAKLMGPRSWPFVGDQRARWHLAALRLPH